MFSTSIAQNSCYLDPTFSSGSEICKLTPFKRCIFSTVPLPLILKGRGAKFGVCAPNILKYEAISKTSKKYSRVQNKCVLMNR